MDACLGKWLDGWKDGTMYGWIDDLWMCGWVSGQMDGCIDGKLVLHDIVNMMQVFSP